jgi:hypothetical protein
MLNEPSPSSGGPWPDLDYASGRETFETLHLMTQIVGKIRLARTPWLNHSWHVTLYVSARGLTTSPIPDGERAFEIRFDFIAHQLVVETTDGGIWRLDLRPRPVADFYAALIEGLAGLGVHVGINETPNELPDPIRVSEDRVHAAYDPEQARRLWLALVQIDRVLKLFLTGFIGKCSPVHFFWGSFDLAVTRFSRRRAPPHPGGVPHLADAVFREAYSHEVSSASAAVEPEGAFFSDALQEFILPYDAVRFAPAPDAALLRFLQSAYEAAAEAGKWSRGALECPLGAIDRPRPTPV